MIRHFGLILAWVFLAAGAAGIIASVHRRFDLNYSSLDGWTSFSLRGGGLDVVRANPSWADGEPGWRLSITPAPMHFGGMLPLHRSSYEMWEINVPLWAPVLLVAGTMAWGRWRTKTKTKGFEVIQV